MPAIAPARILRLTDLKMSTTERAIEKNAVTSWLKAQHTRRRLDKIAALVLNLLCESKIAIERSMKIEPRSCL
ncbi:MAG: hypothetical protein QXG90_03110 [Candidatus Nezhaarchaeales archaeon]